MSAPRPSAPKYGSTPRAPSSPDRRGPESTAAHRGTPDAETFEAELRHRRGDVWMVTADPERPAVGNEIWSNRPALIISNNTLNARSGFAQVVYLSTSTHKRSGPTHVMLPSPDGRGGTMALCEQVHTVDASRLQRKLGEIPAGRFRDVDAALTLSMSIGRNPDTFSAFRKWEEHIKLHGIDIAEEIQALSGLTTDQRVESLTRALELVTVQRDSYRNLYEVSQGLPGVMKGVAESLEEGSAASEDGEAHQRRRT